MEANNDPIFTFWLLKLNNCDLEVETDYSSEAIKISKHRYCNTVNTIFNVTEMNEQNVSQTYSTAILSPNDDCTKCGEHDISNLLLVDINIYLITDSV